MTTPSSLPIRALACDGLAKTAYTRAGTGPTVVLVAADADIRQLLLAALSPHFRVIAPDPPAPSEPGDGGPAFSAWLGGFLDAVGAERVTLVADERFGAAAIAFAVLDEGRADSVALALRWSESGVEPPRPVAASLRHESDLTLVWIDTQVGLPDQALGELVAGHRAGR